jgi:cellulose synthase/poly-beta-1,6-N-acetylglucosamine synthase-like glycosyltransferase
MSSSGSSFLVVVFWCSLALIVYSYLLYPCLLRAARYVGRTWRQSPVGCEPISVVIAARNEESRIASCVQNTWRIMCDSNLDGEIIVVSDGSQDATAERVRELEHPHVRVIELLRHCGKSVALNRGCAAASHNLLVFADTRQTWDRDALRRLLENFADPQVGAASGELVLRQADGTLAGVGLYWRLEKWMRRQESALHSCLGVTGAMCAVRRKLFSSIPPGTILDDVYWPMKVVLAGYRVVHDARARVYDRLPARRRDELVRKIRTLSGNFQLLVRLPSVLLPWRNPMFFPFVSHKVSRLVVPWAMIAALVTSALLEGPVYRAAFAAQCVLYAIALAGLYSRAAAQLRLVSTASAFVFLNSACLLAFFVWLLGAADGSWHSVQYDVETNEVEPSQR